MAKGESGNRCRLTGDGAGGEGIRDADTTLASQCWRNSCYAALALDCIADYYRIT